MTVKDFIYKLYREDFEECSTDAKDRFLNSLWHHGFIEEEDILNSEKTLLRKNAARLIHVYLRDKLHQKDERDISKAEKLRDIYDCRVCMNHIAQVYTKGIIEAIEIPELSSKENDIFKIFGGSYEADDEDIKLWLERLKGVIV